MEINNSYPPDWKSGAIQQHIKAAAAHTCEHCGLVFSATSNLAEPTQPNGVTTSPVNRNGKPIIGTVHHINGNRADNRYENLVFLCQRCHMALHTFKTTDGLRWKPGKLLLAKWGDKPPRWIVARGLPYKIQPRLF